METIICLSWFLFTFGILAVGLLILKKDREKGMEV